MSDIYLPPHIVRQQRQEFEAKILRNVTIEDARAREFTEALQKINPDMFMVRAHDTIDADVPLRPGFYHLLVRNPDAPMTVATVHENGAYAEPDSRVFDLLGRGNLRERRVRERLAEQERDGRRGRREGDADDERGTQGAAQGHRPLRHARAGLDGPHDPVDAELAGEA
jgi:hypothetical protein